MLVMAHWPRQHTEDSKITGQMYAIAEEAQDLVKILLQPSPSGFSWIMPRTLSQELYSSSVEQDSIRRGRYSTFGEGGGAYYANHGFTKASQGQTRRRLPKASTSVIPSRAGLRRDRSYHTRPDPQHFLQHVRFNSLYFIQIETRLSVPLWKLP